MIEPAGLFPTPEQPPTRPGKFNVQGPVGDRIARVTWTPIKLKTPTACDACSHLQHVTAGAYGPRADARHRRTAHHLSGRVSAKLLCTQHADTLRSEDRHKGLIRP